MIRWSRRGTCANPGCTDPECGCSMCGKPIGIPEGDSRLEGHSEDCPGCEICEDQVPVVLFQGKGHRMEQATLHQRCFNEVLAKGVENVGESAQSATSREPAVSAPVLHLGSCCACGAVDVTARNILMLPFCSPEGGDGCWGCFTCDIPTVGAVAVVCDACLESRVSPRWACLGEPSKNRRISIDQLTEPLQHNSERHNPTNAYNI